VFGRYVLLPGDPDRIGIMAAQWTDARLFDLPRGFRAATGGYRGQRLGAIATGIGGPSLEVVLHQAAELGADTFIRVGTSGAIHEWIENGDLVIDEASVRFDGTSDLYVPPGYPAAASWDVIASLVDACRSMGYRHHVGIGATMASFYAGQARPAFGGYERSDRERLIPDLRAARVLNLEMEAATLFTLGRVLGLRTGAIVSIVASRITGDWDDAGGVERACRAAAEAVSILAGRDASTPDS
jgi:uridine phosphorylase